MKRDYFSFARLLLPVVFSCVVLAIALGFLEAPSPRPVLAALHDPPASPYHNVIVVAKSGGDYYSVQKALNSITDNSPTNHYLVWVAPGTYTETVTMKPYVDIEGAGEMATRIVNTGGIGAATLFGASNAELRYLTVESTSFNFSTAILNSNASPSLLHVTAISSSSTSDGASMGNPGKKSPDIYQFFGIHNINAAPNMVDVTVSNTVGLNGLGYGMYNDNSSPTMRDVTISVAGGNIATYALYNNNSSPTMKDVTISSSGGTANYGMYNNNSSSTMKDVTISSAGPGLYSFGAGTRVTLDDSTITTPSNTIYDSSSFVMVGNSKLEGGPVSGSPVTCAGVYDENYTFYPNTCP